jgi:hypothetical protein
MPDASEGPKSDDANTTKNSTIYSIQKPQASALLGYIFAAMIMSLGYSLIIIDIADTLLLPDEATFSFLLEEQIWGLIVPNLLIIIIAPIVWAKVSGAVLAFRSYSDHYIEAETNITNLNDIWSVFKNKILSGISANIGFTFIIAYLIYFFLPEDLTGNDALFLSIMVMQLVPLIISVLVPVNWVLNDSLIRYEDEKGLVHDVGEDMNKGLLRKFIGIGGLILGLDVCYQLAFNSEFTFILNWYVTGIYFVFFFILLSSGTIVLISLIYLSQFHESGVNSLRSSLAKELPVARTIVDYNLPSAIKEGVVSIEEKRAGTRNAAFTVLIIVALIILALCEYYILFEIGPFTLM